MSSALLPTDISFDNTDVKAAVARDVLKNGWFHWMVRKAKADVIASTGSLKLQLQVAPCTEDGTPRQPHFFHDIFVPFNNPKVPGQKAHKSAFNQSYWYLRAVDPVGFPLMPVWKAKEWWSGDGVMLKDKEEAQEITQQIGTLVFNEMKIRYFDPQKFIGDMFFGLLQPDKINAEYQRLHKLSHEAPPGVDVIYSDFVTSAEE